MALSSHDISNFRAKEIAKNFLEQHHSGVAVNSIEHEDGVWTVKATVFSYGKRDKKVRIDGNSGRILSVE
jgi:uncharacterized membrane protein YkoI